jgi:ATP diphosphatase
VPSAAPALLRAERLTEKASRIGFDYPDLASVRAQLAAELAELDEALESRDRQEIDHELGDVFLMLVNLARFTKTPPEDALRATLRRFTYRFQAVERGMKEANLPLGEATLAQMDAFWNQAKALEKAGAPLAPPKQLPRAPPSLLTLSTPSLKDARAFWDEVAKLLSWARGADRGGEVVYDTGAVRLRFCEGPGTRGLELDLELASKAQLEALWGLLTQARAKVERLGESALVFSGPESATWRAQVGLSTRSV